MNPYDGTIPTQPLTRPEIPQQESRSDVQISSVAFEGPESAQAKNMCSWAHYTLESAVLGASKGDIEWALTKTLTAVKTLKRAKSLMASNE